MSHRNCQTAGGRTVARLSFRKIDPNCEGVGEEEEGEAGMSLVGLQIGGLNIFSLVWFS